MIERVIGVTVLWVALWGDLSAANVLWGAVLGVLLGWAFPVGDGRGARLRPVAVLRLAWHVLASLVVSSLTVARAVLVPSPARTGTSMHRVPLRTGSPLVASVVANSITLTPGTMTVACDPDTLELRVHVLGEVDAADLRAQVARLEHLAAEAFGIDLPDTATDGRSEG